MCGILTGIGILFLKNAHGPQTDVNMNLKFSITGMILFFPLVIYSVICHRRIGYVFEYIVFYHDLLIDKEIQQAALQMSAPIKISSRKFDHPKYCEKNESGLFRLCEEPLTAPQVEGKSILSMIKQNCEAGFYTSRGAKKIVFPDTASKADETSQLCLICFDKAPECFFLPCGNAGLCSSCGLTILKTSGTCHLCRAVNS